MNPGTAVASSTPSPSYSSSCLKKPCTSCSPRHIFLSNNVALSISLLQQSSRSVSCVEVMLIDIAILIDIQQLATSTSNAFLLVIGTDILHTVPHILIDHDEHDVSAAPCLVVTSVPRCTCTSQAFPLHLFVPDPSLGVTIRTTAGATDRRIDCVHAQKCMAKPPCGLGSFHFLLSPPSVLHVLQLPHRRADGGCCICTTRSPSPHLSCHLSAPRQNLAPRTDLPHFGWWNSWRFLFRYDNSFAFSLPYLGCGPVQTV